MAATLVPLDGSAPIVLEKPIILIGRHQDCDIPLPAHAKVSRRHCCIVQAGERYVVRDLGSMNGLRVNGERVQEVELHPGDEVAVADAVFTFRLALTRSGSRNGAPLQEAPASDDEIETPRADLDTGRDNRQGAGRKQGVASDSHHGQAFAGV